jgi:hypothetical protein
MVLAISDRFRRPVSGIRVPVLALAAMALVLLVGPRADASGPSPIPQAIGRQPLGFEANHGQTDPSVDYLARGNGYTLFLTRHEVVFSVLAPEQAEQTGASEGVDKLLGARPSHPDASIIRMRLLGSEAESTVTATDLLPGVANYFRGQDPRKWVSGVPRYARVEYDRVYPGVNLVYYGNEGRLEYDFAVAAGARVDSIGWSLEGARARVEAATGDLVLQAGTQELRFHKPVAYQQTGAGNAEREFVNAGYVVEAGNRVRFSVADYDHSRALVIDPALSYSTYLGGSSNDYGASVAVDSAGNAYVTGYTTSVDFPITPGAYQPTCSAGCASYDVFVSKLNPTGSQLLYSTYIGGSAKDYGNGIAVDSAGDAFIVGQTFSNDFPVTPGALQTKCGGTSCNSGDAFVLELNPSGTQLVYSTYLGGKSINQGNGIALDSAGDAYVTGYTQSTDFPTTAGVVQPTCTCSQHSDLFVTELNPSGSALVYSTYYGGSLLDVAYTIAVDPNNNAYVTGYTQSTDFPTTTGAYQSSLNAPEAAFMLKLNSTATVVGYATYLGGSTTATTPCETCGTTVAVNSSGNAFVCGLTAESNFPVTKGAYQTKFKSTSKGHDAFITEFNLDGTGVVFSTYFGGSADDGCTGLQLDQSGNVWLKGNTKSTDLPITAAAFQTTNMGSFDAFVAALDSTGSHLVYSTYLGGSGTEFGGATAMMVLGNQNPPNIYAITYTDSTNFPVTTGAYQTTNKGMNDTTISLIVPSPNVQFSPTSLVFGNQGVGTTSPPQMVTLTNVGNTTMTVASISVLGANQADFGQTNNCTSLAASASCTITVTFSPSATGTRTATISVTDDAPGSPHTISLTGFGITNGPIVALSPTSLTFPTLVVGSTSSAMKVTLTNSGNQTLNISSIAASGDFAQTNTCGATVSAGASCTISVTFTPTTASTRTGSVTITDDASDSPQTVSLTGTGTWMQLTPASMNFGTVTVGVTSPPQTVTVTNTANFKITMTGISLAGTHPRDYAQTNTCGATLGAGASCTVTITFTPTKTGVRGATLNVKDTGGGSPQTVSLTGTGQ